jgi:hypothetical protein
MRRAFYKGEHMKNILSKKTENSNHYSASDFYLAAYLKAKGMKLVNFAREGRRVTFIFEDQEDRAQWTSDFYNNCGVVQVNPFVHAIQDLKSIIYNMHDVEIEKIQQPLG